MKTESFGEPENGGTFFDVIFAVIVVLASGFSAYTTYLGFSKDFPVYMSVPIATIIGLGLLGVNFKIRETRKEGERVFRPFLVFFVIFVFSFISNTNAFYSRLIEKDIVEETQKEAWLVFDEESSKAMKQLDSDEQYQRELTRLSEVETERTKLRDQITDPRNPGLGERAQEHVNRIEELLETNLTRFEPPPQGAPLHQFEQFASRMVDHINDLINERQTQGVVMLHHGLNNQIAQFRNKHRERMNNRDYMRSHTDEMHRDLKEIENQTNRILSPDPALSLKEVNDRADEVGKFKFTWQNFVEFISPVAIVLSIVLGALLDILAPTMSLALYRPLPD